ncbi:conjugal transfer protein TraJ [Halarcobacter mediterraneus]|uniref:Conjugal transfer protein TraJ n=1 Tax=Halarcobacter mediterraneus TaxID=2023153 RepID=A0A4V1M1D0_9BACT|nr:type IV secretion system protein [Halarcobacter mediterraneus]RXK13234.1 conjugal transfer protein TraJ [Halarcobacter mediterraneus]
MAEKYDSEKALDFETSKQELYDKSQRRAWGVAITMTFVTCLLAIAIIVLVPLKTVVPYMTMVDKNGRVEIISTVTTEKLSKQEALDKYFAKVYVQTREQYFYDMLQKDYIETQIFSSENVAADYRKIFSGDDSRDKELKDDVEISVNVNSVVLSESAGTKIATVRAKLSSKNLTTNTELIRSYKVFTFSYDYYPDLKQNAKERLVNPLGYKVLTYRIDDEVN